MKVTNKDVFEGKSAMQELLKCRLPVKVSSQAAKLSRMFNEALKDMDVVRRGLIDTYGVESDKGRGREVVEYLEDGTLNPEYKKFMDEWSELLKIEVNIASDKVKLPETISATCDKCHHNMDRPLEIEPWILAALDKFVEVP